MELLESAPVKSLTQIQAAHVGTIRLGLGSSLTAGSWFNPQSTVNIHSNNIILGMPIFLEALKKWAFCNGFPVISARDPGVHFPNQTRQPHGGSKIGHQRTPMFVAFWALANPVRWRHDVLGIYMVRSITDYTLSSKTVNEQRSCPSILVPSWFSDALVTILVYFSFLCFSWVLLREVPWARKSYSTKDAADGFGAYSLVLSLACGLWVLLSAVKWRRMPVGDQHASLLYEEEKYER